MAVLTRNYWNLTTAHSNLERRPNVHTRHKANMAYWDYAKEVCSAQSSEFEGEYRAEHTELERLGRILEINDCMCDVFATEGVLPYLPTGQKRCKARTKRGQQCRRPTKRGLWDMDTTCANHIGQPHHNRIADVRHEKDATWGDFTLV